eukprot:CAMPEP_0185573440 /NCGR_PEP_ID=MMETSP0434-20130131/5151_1 /TAXON_ID=626734 ORGANISM="Favella taraikaensis, Strain Fe Narragansett Bay" /NCGR_SAMPLE_ID=MMETSP0434 /ASSEMBLY_ACC=CAM_ASM_000379 /LENGTH=111 /DNA_ID=CAMNT_0028189665 /DNA_START=25 /DNA_END=358 /DNA_ORIENTATION=+
MKLALLLLAVILSVATAYNTGLRLNRAHLATAGARAMVTECGEGTGVCKTECSSDKHMTDKDAGCADVAGKPKCCRKDESSSGSSSGGSGSGSSETATDEPSDTQKKKKFY